MSKFHEDRLKALAWWREIVGSQRVSHILAYQNSLKDNDVVKKWSVEMINTNSYTIQKIWEFINNLH